jgi:hypothetical protein
VDVCEQWYTEVHGRAAHQVVVLHLLEKWKGPCSSELVTQRHTYVVRETD